MGPGKVTTMETQVVGLIILLALSNVECDLLEHFQFYPTDNHRTGLDIRSDIQGAVEWIETSNSSLEIFVHISRADVRVKTDDIRVNTNFSADRIAISVIRDINNSPLVSNALRSSGSRIVLQTLHSLALALTVIATLSERKHSLILLLLLCITYNLGCIASPVHNDVTCTIVIHYPKFYKFNEVNIVMNLHNTRIPRQIIEKSDSVSCSPFPVQFTNGSDGCISCCYGNGVCGLDNVCHCDPDFDPNTSCKQRLSPKTKLYISALDQRLAKIISVDGTVFSFRGKKRQSGKVKVINRVVMQTTKGDYFQLDLIGGKKPMSMYFRNDTDSVSIKHTTNCKLSISGRKKDAAYSLLVDQCINAIDFIRLETNANEQNRTNTTRALQPEYPVLSAEDKTDNNERFGIFRTRKGYRHLEIPVSVKSCDPDSQNPRVIAEVFVQNDTEAEPIVFEAKKLRGYGDQHFLSLPLKPTKMFPDSEQTTDQETLCNGFQKSLVQTCEHLTKKKDTSFLKSACSEKKSNYTSVNGNGFPDTGTVPTETLCSLFNDMIKGICEIVAYWSTDRCTYFVDQFQSFSVSSNDSVVIKAIYPESRTLKSNTYLVDTEFEISKKDSNEVVLFDRHFTPKLTQAIILPRRPRPSHGYAVKMEYSCATPSTLVQMSVTGSDNYSQEVVCRGPQECNCCVLYVAGGHHNVSDAIHVSLTDNVSGANEIKNFNVTF